MRVYNRDRAKEALHSDPKRDASGLAIWLKNAVARGWKWIKIYYQRNFNINFLMKYLQFIKKNRISRQNSRRGDSTTRGSEAAFVVDSCRVHTMVRIKSVVCCKNYDRCRRPYVCEHCLLCERCAKRRDKGAPLDSFCAECKARRNRVGRSRRACASTTSASSSSHCCR